MQTEYEARFLDVDVVVLRNQLKDMGAYCVHPEILMKRKVYRVAGGKGIQKRLRVRQEHDQVTLSLKQKSIENTTIDKVKEIQLIVDDFDATCDLLEHLGYHLKSYEENRREKRVQQKNNVEYCIDTRPGLHPFLEIEGPSKNIVSTCAQGLALHMQTAFFGSVFDTYHEKLGYSYEYLMNLKNITFKNPPKI